MNINNLNIIRPLNGLLFKATSSIFVNSESGRVKEIYWVNCDEDGNLLDKGVKPKIQICKLKEGQDDIDITSLSNDCLNNLG